MVKLNKIEKKNWRTNSRILGSRMSLECFVSVVQRQKLTANGLKPKQKVWCQVSYFGSSHWEGLRKTVFLKSKQNTWKICVKEFLISLYKKSCKNHICVYFMHFLFILFFNTARESDKSYMINHVVYFDLKTHDFYGLNIRIVVFDLETACAVKTKVRDALENKKNS